MLLLPKKCKCIAAKDTHDDKKGHSVLTNHAKQSNERTKKPEKPEA
jgi:hypothetical protein